MVGRVKGSLFVDYVRMVRSHKDVNWSRYLQPQDVEFLRVRIHPDAWYPMDSFARLGLAILDNIAGGDPLLARGWGRMSVDQLAADHGAQLVAKGDPRESLMRLIVLRNTFFDFDALALPQLTDVHACVHVSYGMESRAEQAACFQTIGFFSRLVEIAGGRSVTTTLVKRVWEGDPVTEFNVDWERPATDEA